MVIGWFLHILWFPVLFGSNVFHSKSIFRLVPFTFYVSSVVWLQTVLCAKSIIWVVPFTCYGSQCCLAPKCFLLKMSIMSCSFTFYCSRCCLAPMCFPLKINILGGSLHFSWFPVLFGSNVFSTQNQYFGWFSSLYMVLCVVCFQCCLVPI